MADEKNKSYQLLQEPLFKDLIKALIHNRGEGAFATNYDVVNALVVELQRKGYSEILIAATINDYNKRF